MEKRKLDLLMLSSDMDLWNLSHTALSSSSSRCFLFFRLLRRSLALFELSLDVPEEDSEVGPPLPLYSPLSVAAAAATCQPIRAQRQLSWRPGACLGVEERAWHEEPNQPQTPFYKWTSECFHPNQNIWYRWRGTTVPLCFRKTSETKILGSRQH